MNTAWRPSVLAMLRAIALVLCLAAPHAQAGDVYVWTDAEGRRQISDVVPPKYAGKARRIVAPEPPARPAPGAGSAAAGGSAAPAAPAAPSAADCQTRWEIYADARECLAFFEGLDPALAASGRASCPVVQPPPAACAAPASGLSSR